MPKGSQEYSSLLVGIAKAADHPDIRDIPIPTSLIR